VGVTDPTPPVAVVEPVAGPLDAVVQAPGSKSLTNRALVCAALAGGRSVLDGALVADDTEALVECLRRLGVEVEVTPTAAANARLTVEGAGGRLPRAAGARLDARLSGTTARFLLPVLALDAGPSRLDGAPPLRARPMADGIAAVRALGADVVEEGGHGHLPVVVRGPAGDPAGTGSAVTVAGDASSQFLSGLLLAGPAWPGGLAIRTPGALVSRPYVDMTVAVMERFGAEVTTDTGSTAGDAAGGWTVAPGGYRPTGYAVEPDASAASYLFAAAAICGGRVTVEGLGRGSLQGDLAFVDVLEQMGCRVERADDATTVVRDGPLRGVDVHMGDLSDTAQTLAAVAVFAETPTRVRGIGFIRAKETDRVGNVVAELHRAGVDAVEEPDGYLIHPGPVRPGVVVRTYEDHRMAMSFALLGLRAPGIAVADPGVVAKTFPTYWHVLASLGRAVGANRSDPPR
jgi:3-phosphoshikimate 1-carboxyvinyltransferase